MMQDSSSGMYHHSNNASSDTFFLQYFDAAFPDLDFSELQPGETDEQVGENIQALIDLLAEDIYKGRADVLRHISGLEIACGNPDHCLELIQLIHQLTQVMAADQSSQQLQSSPEGSGDNYPMMKEEEALKIND